MALPNYIQARQRSTKHRREILDSRKCGCFHCCTTFKPSEIGRWTDVDKAVGQTALCPKCGMDAVIGDKSGYPITVRFLTKMNKYWY